MAEPNGCSGKPAEKPGSDEESLGVWCRKCRSPYFETIKTERGAYGDVRTHRCKTCGEEFGSIATWTSKAFAYPGPPLKPVKPGD